MHVSADPPLRDRRNLRLLQGLRRGAMIVRMLGVVTLLLTLCGSRLGGECGGSNE
jgi:hypothetical protein